MSHIDSSMDDVVDCVDPQCCEQDDGHEQDDEQEPTVHAPDQSMHSPTIGPWLSPLNNVLHRRRTALVS